MSKSFLIDKALCLPSADIEALIEGRIIAAIPRKLLNTGDKFALYPVDTSSIPLSIEQYYRPSFSPIAQSYVQQIDSPIVSIKAWAKCERCQMLDKTKPLDVLSQLTIWTPEAFEAILQKKPYIFLAYLRVYHLAEFKEISVNPDIKEKLGKFIGLSDITASEAKPVLSDRIFAQRQRQLQNLEPLEHPELEELQSALSQIASTYPAAQQLDNEIKIFLGWSSDTLTQSINADLAWIKTIVSLGDRSIELDEKKSNYHAGTDFEIIARQSLDFLGFKIEQAYKGGAGGLDLYCSQPYPLVCECKAGRLIPSGTVEELIKLGGMHLGREQFINSAKLVIGPGKPSKDTEKAAQEWKVSIINAMTLQKLVELKAKYPGAINLIELQKYLEPGQIDYKIDEYIDKIENQIKLRSHIIQLVKNYLQNSGNKSTGVETLNGVYFGSNPPHPLKTEEMQEILIELSSPLTGYLGREKGKDWKSDRFYFLRDLPTTPK
ncbi:DUF1802 family protein [Nodularia spumigena CS-588/02]|uniref:DUF1802 family protein n=1 Tax=Nodularia spumigena TaxID=70799 RepID=UPI00232C9334|nr:DUF1802 family protein [Nodularia spumigena]MDB9347852.1 DUF1802 family protein [Nodularia spumigena CS-588/01]MDB9354279.1 DUF1802 family protein [Nodularia spumigena CS-588/05]MDB9360009.1 DUF1802 family protein [Nodularia spumigena CS-588/02]MDB9363563.1 DUF1802 family protein [Nodularia spumigena CS-588/02A10]